MKNRRNIEENNLLNKRSITIDAEETFNKRQKSFLSYKDIDDDGNTVLHHRLNDRIDATFIDYIIRMYPQLLKISNNQGIKPIDIAVKVFSTKDKNSAENLSLLINSGEELSPENFCRLAKSGLTQEEFLKIISKGSFKSLENITSSVFIDKLFEGKEELSLSWLFELAKKLDMNLPEDFIQRFQNMYNTNFYQKDSEARTINSEDRVIFDEQAILISNGDEFLNNFLKKFPEIDTSNIDIVFETRKIAKPTLFIDGSVPKIVKTHNMSESPLVVEVNIPKISFGLGKSKSSLSVNEDICETSINSEEYEPTLFVKEDMCKSGTNSEKAGTNLAINKNNCEINNNLERSGSDIVVNADLEKTGQNFSVRTNIPARPFILGKSKPTLFIF